MKYPLHTIRKHFFLRMDEKLWLVDTGAPQSFGSDPKLELGGLTFDIPGDYGGLTSGQLSEFLSVDCHGLLGADVWGSFDIKLDQPGESIQLTVEKMEADGNTIKLEAFMNIPIVTVEIDGAMYRMFLDTGAQISYFQGDSLTSHPKAGSLEDFYPGFGSFRTDVYNAPVTLGTQKLSLSFGMLPELLANTLTLANTQGIIGNQLFIGKSIGFFPRTHRLILPK